MRQIAIDGVMKSVDDASIPLFDRAVRYGESLFETIRIVDGRPYLLDEHLGRMRRSAEMLHYTEISRDAIAEALATMLTTIDGMSGRLRLMVTRGDLPAIAPSVILEFTSLDEIPPIPLPLDLIIHPSRIESTDLPFKPKGPGYSTEMRIIEEIRRDGYHECLRLTAEELVGEGCLSNIFWIADGALRTPSTSLGVLPGIMRRRIVAIAEDMGLRCEIGAWSHKQLIHADEIFMTNALRGVMPVRRIVDLVELSASGEWSTRLMLQVEKDSKESVDKGRENRRQGG